MYEHPPTQKERHARFVMAYETEISRDAVALSPI